MSQATGHAESPRALVERWLVDVDAPPALAFVRIDERGGYRFCLREADGLRCGHDVADFDQVYLLAVREPAAAVRLVDALSALSCEARRAVAEFREVHRRLEGGRRGPASQVWDTAPVCRWRDRRAG